MIPLSLDHLIDLLLKQRWPLPYEQGHMIMTAERAEHGALRCILLKETLAEGQVRIYRYEVPVSVALEEGQELPFERLCVLLSDLCEILFAEMLMSSAGNAKACYDELLRLHVEQGPRIDVLSLLVRKAVQWRLFHASVRQPLIAAQRALALACFYLCPLPEEVIAAVPSGFLRDEDIASLAHVYEAACGFPPPDRVAFQRSCRQKAQQK